MGTEVSTIPSLRSVYRDTKANLDALTGLRDGDMAYGTDTVTFYRQNGDGAANWEAMPKGLTFTELMSTAHGPSAANTWEDWDLSAIVPAGTKSVLVCITNQAAAGNRGCRKNGSALVRYWYLNAADMPHMFILTECDANRIIEIYYPNTDAHHQIVGYWS